MIIKGGPCPFLLTNITRMQVGVPYLGQFVDFTLSYFLQDQVLVRRTSRCPCPPSVSECGCVLLMVYKSVSAMRETTSEQNSYALSPSQKKWEEAAVPLLKAVMNTTATTQDTSNMEHLWGTNLFSVKVELRQESDGDHMVQDRDGTRTEEEAFICQIYIPAY